MKARLLSLMLIAFLCLNLPLIAQSTPYLSAPVNGSTWETTTPTLYWWYVPTPYYAGPFDYNVQVSSNQSNFTSSLLVDVTLSGYGGASYSIPSSAGLIPGHSYYWRVGVNGNYSAIATFSPYGSSPGGSTITYYDIIATAGPHGSIDPSGSISLSQGSDIAFTITPDLNYAVDDVLLDGLSIGAVSSFQFTNVTSDHTLNASFVAVQVYDTVFVAVTGSDLNGDGSRTKPYRTIQRGHDMSDPEGYVYVFNGNYAEDNVLTKPISIVGQTNPSTRSFIIESDDILIKNFVVTQSSPGPGIQKVSFATYHYRQNLTLENLTVHNNAELGLLLENIDNITVRNCHFYGNDMGGIGLWSCNNVLIEDVVLEDNLRGLWAYQSKDITINQLSAFDNGKGYIALYPDFNGLTFTVCENLTFTDVLSNSNEEQGFKFEDCTFITLNNVSAFNNNTDGFAFIESSNIDFNTGFANSNGSTSDDNGIEMIACTNVEFSDVAANDNFNTGFLLDYNYTGVYKWDPRVSIPTPLPTEYYGPSTGLVFENVSADNNGNDGLYGIHLTDCTFENLAMTYNANNGLLLDAASDISLIGGTFDYNLNGIVLNPTINLHPLAPMLSSDEITGFQFTGTASVSYNEEIGLYMKPFPTSKIVEPFLYGDFSFFENGIGAILLEGEIQNPIFSGIYCKGISMDDSFGICLTSGPNPAEEPSGAKINNSTFVDYEGIIDNYAISLVYNGYASTNDVNARNNIFTGAMIVPAGPDLYNMDVIYDWVDAGGTLGIVDFTGWTSGEPIFRIGSASAYTGSLVTIPVSVDIGPVPISFNELRGTLEFNDLALSYKYATTGTGTIIHDADWGIIYDHSVSDELKFWAIGFNTINSSGILFNLTFEVVDTNDGIETVTCNPFNLIEDGIANQFVVVDGTINYTANTSISLLKGDASLNFAVDQPDYIAVLNHIAGLSLTGQALINADVNLDGEVDELDLADINAYINNGGVWPHTPFGGSANLAFTAANVDYSGMLRFPVTLTNSVDVRSLQIELKYDESQIDFRNYIQLMSANGIYVDAFEVSEGVTKFIFTSANGNNGILVPAELMFNITGDRTVTPSIRTTYSINGGELKEGPNFGSTNVTGVEDNEFLPTTFEVSQNYPNPFNPSTTIRYSIPEAGFVTIKVYDILGRVVKTLVNEELNAGRYQITWEGDNNFGSKVSSGIYFYRVLTHSEMVTKKMMLLR